MDEVPGFVGGLVGGSLGMLALSHVPYAALKRIPIPRWMAVGLSPVPLYVVALWGYWNRGVANPSIGYALGAMVFVALRCRTEPKSTGRALALAVGGMGCLLALFGPTTQYNAARLAMIEGCRNTAREQGMPNIEAAELTAYCGCTTEGMVGPACKKFSLLWSKAATEDCARRAMAAMATPAGRLQIEALKDFCVEKHLPAHRPALLAAVRRDYTERSVQELLRQGELVRADVDEAAKSRFANCYVNAVFDACPKQTRAGYAECFLGTPADDMGEHCVRAFQQAQAEAEKTKATNLLTPPPASRSSR